MAWITVGALDDEMDMIVNADKVFAVKQVYRGAEQNHVVTRTVIISVDGGEVECATSLQDVKAKLEDVKFG